MDLPLELWIEISSHLHPADLVRLQCTCQSIRSVFGSKAMWQYLLQHRFQVTDPQPQALYKHLHVSSTHGKLLPTVYSPLHVPFGCPLSRNCGIYTQEIVFKSPVAGCYLPIVSLSLEYPSLDLQRLSFGFQHLGPVAITGQFPKKIQLQLNPITLHQYGDWVLTISHDNDWNRFGLQISHVSLNKLL